MPLVALNPGHFPGLDPGACGNGLQEADITLQLVNLIAPQLPAYGIDCIIIHENELADICDKANASGADLFISLHINAGGGTGYEDYTCCAESDKANAYRDLLRIEVMNYLRQYEVTDRGKKHSAFYVLRQTDAPAILCENLFIDNAKDAAKLADPVFISGLADAYVKGIARALGYSKLPQAEVVVPEWAKDAVMWGIGNALLDTQEGSHDWYRFLTFMHRYHKQFYKE